MREIKPGLTESTIPGSKGVPDHVHLACAVPPSLSISQVIKVYRGKSAHFINHMAAGAQYMACHWSGVDPNIMSRRDYLPTLTPEFIQG